MWMFVLEGGQASSRTNLEPRVEGCACPDFFRSDLLGESHTFREEKESSHYSVSRQNTRVTLECEYKEGAMAGMVRGRSGSIVLENKVAVVTGGTGVLGTAFCEGLALEGAHVVVVGRRADVAEALALKLEQTYGRDMLAAPADVLDQLSLVRCRDRIIDKFGRIDVLVNGAGGNQKGATVSPEGSFFDVPRAAMEHVFELNITGTMLPTQIFGEVMAKQQGAASIINISSVSSTSPLTRVVGYSAAKAGVENFTKWLAVELARKHGRRIRVNALQPGFFLAEQNRALLTNADGSLTARGQTIVDHTPLGRFGEPKELIPALTFLASEQSSFVTGSILVVDGGCLAVVCASPRAPVTPPPPHAPQVLRLLRRVKTSPGRAPRPLLCPVSSAPPALSPPFDLKWRPFFVGSGTSAIVVVGGVVARAGREAAAAAIAPPVCAGTA